MQNKTGGAAFPRPMSVSHGAYGDHQGIIFEQAGMTLRQYYKARFVQGWIAIYGPNDTLNQFDRANMANIAKKAGELADALIAEDEEFEKRFKEEFPNLAKMG